VVVGALDRERAEGPYFERIFVYDSVGHGVYDRIESKAAFDEETRYQLSEQEIRSILINYCVHSGTSVHK
jgi:hypothetical protein